MRGKIARRAVTGLVLAGTALPAAAAIPPIFQRLGELETVLNRSRLDTTLRMPIDRIEIIGPRLYRVTAGRCHIDVRLVEIRGGAGDGLRPPMLDARPGRPVCEH